MTELWRPVVGYVALYEVSSLGRVRSLARIAMRSNGSPCSVREKIVGGWTRSGYTMLGLHDGKKSQTIFAHRVVAAAFLGELPAGMEVCHGNGVRSDNRIENLRYGTRSDNMRDAIKHGTHFTPFRGFAGENKRGHKLTDVDVLAIRASGARVTHLAAQYGVARSLIRRIKDREAWRHV